MSVGVHHSTFKQASPSKAYQLRLMARPDKLSGPLFEIRRCKMLPRIHGQITVQPKCWVRNMQCKCDCRVSSESEVTFSWKTAGNKDVVCPRRRRSEGVQLERNGQSVEMEKVAHVSVLTQFEGAGWRTSCAYVPHKQTLHLWFLVKTSTLTFTTFSPTFSEMGITVSYGKAHCIKVYD